MPGLTRGKYTCFVISPIGEAGTEVRGNADNLLDLIIRPALEIYDFIVTRADHHSDQGNVDADVIKYVQESDLCVADISIPNPNVYYELGRRDETGKPVLLLRSRSADKAPMDISGRRYIEYDLNSSRSVRDAQLQLRNAVEPLMKAGMESTNAASLSELAAILSRVERKMDRMLNENVPTVAPGEATLPSVGKGDPVDDFKVALLTQDMNTAERCMALLRPRYNKLKFLDLVVEQVAAMGSIQAGQILMDEAQYFFDSDTSFKKKMEYLGCLVTFSNKCDREDDVMQLLEPLLPMLEQEATEADPEDQVELYNELNRLNYGLYVETDDVYFLDNAIEYCRMAVQISPKNFVYHNLAVCLHSAGNDLEARDAIENCLRLDEQEVKKPNDDHYYKACEIYYALGDIDKYNEYKEKLAAINASRALLLKHRLEKA